MDWLSFLVGCTIGVAATWYYGRRTIRKAKKSVPQEYWPDQWLARSNITILRRKYLNAAIFFATIGIATAGAFLIPTDMPQTVNRFEQCQKVMRAPDTDRMAREKKHCIEEFQQLTDIGGAASQ
jgi:hypothetical protein